MRHDAIDPEQYTARGWPRARTRVRDRMTAPAVTVRADTPVSSAWELMKARHTGDLLVVDDEQRLVGVLRQIDLRPVIQDPGESALRREPQTGLEPVTVRQLMEHGLVTVGPDLDIADASDAMCDRGIGVLAVMEGGALIGMLSESDVLARPGRLVHWKF